VPLFLFSLEISLCRPREATTSHFRRVPTSCSAASLRIIGAIGTPRPGGNTFLFSRGRWKSGSATAPRAVLDRVMWSSPTTSQARATRRARWEFRGSAPLCRSAPSTSLRKSAKRSEWIGGQNGAMLPRPALRGEGWGEGPLAAAEVIQGAEGPPHPAPALPRRCRPLPARGAR